MFRIPAKNVCVCVNVECETQSGRKGAGEVRRIKMCI